MKKANEIISHLLSPFKEKIDTFRCLKKIIALMPQNYKKYISFMDYKGHTLYIYVSHPALRQEIFYKRKMIFDLINLMHKNNMCINLKPKKIVTFYKYSPPPKPPKDIKFYIKPAGNFEIKAKNEKIIKIFEEIKENLKGKYD
ncbi:DUF721 domain-containing protein [Caminibacter mediatlanticus TB-2]|uniref:DUF721 domain-containing protein n=1 Tax=Caminibacter mediatlanticus TB-2 TaxID=391592 RepID=A0ABX5V8T2_9BACT|nr:DciA family protein [Caminibacter mediatlanticus]QCT94683.1 DUF721 domain-containing protein [Caminibacter mediatlanticus TB-2]